tara:strand:- start:562 stop:2796 length:2235 start_codon:yes stop_codon:yes gene_type:complete
MNKINQIKTTTNRVLSPLQTNTGFLYHVWCKLLDKNISGLTYTQKKFLETILKQCIRENDTVTVGLSILQIQNRITTHFYRLHSFANLKFDNIGYFATENDFNARMVNPKNNTLRIQKFIRIACQHILTEREIRRETKHWESTVGLKIHNTDIDRGFCRYWSKKILLFQYRLYKALTQNATQIVHLAEPKTFFNSRIDKLDHEFIMYRTQSTGCSKHEKPINISEQINCIIGYDTYMQNHLSWSTIFGTQPNVNRLISTTLLDDITMALRMAVDTCPSKIKEDKERYKEYKFNAQLMTEFAMHSCRLPADQSLDRHFTINKEGQMSYSPAKKPTYLTSNGNWLSGAERMITKYGKGVRKLFSTYPDTIEETIIEYVCNYLKSKHTFTAEMVVVSGEDIRYWYHEKRTNFSVNTGTLASSCMRYDRCQPYLDLYVQNPNKIKMLICKENELIIGRALLWHDDDNDKAFMDRIYGTDKTIAACKTWASKNGYLYKNKQSYSDTELITTTGQLISKQFVITLNKPKSKLFPYADTMSRMIKDGDFLKVTNLSSDAFKNCFILDITGGILYGYEQNARTLRRRRGGSIDEFNDELVVFSDGTEYPLDDCTYCEHDECYYHCEDCTYVENDDCSYHNDYIYWVGDYAFYTEGEYDCHVWSDTEDDYLWTDDAYSIVDADHNHIDYASCDNTCYSDYHGVSYHEQDAFYCEVMEDYEHIDNTQQIEVNGTTYEVADFCSYEEVEEYYNNN